MAVKPTDFDSSGDYHGTFKGDEWKVKQESMLKGIVELNNTVDTDRETSWAPGKSFFCGPAHSSKPSPLSTSHTHKVH